MIGLWNDTSTARLESIIEAAKAEGVTVDAMRRFLLGVQRALPKLY